jgi:hypothetical protein
VEDTVVQSPTTAGRADSGTRTLTLRSAARIFFAYGSPRLMALVAVAAVAARIVVGHFSLADLVVAASIQAMTMCMRTASLTSTGGSGSGASSVDRRSVSAYLALRRRVRPWWTTG